MQKIALLVDDSRVARMTLKKLLITAYQFDVVEVGSGEEAIDYLHTNDAKPYVIFMDVMMGGIDGLTATQRIKQTPAWKNIPVVICTGNDTDEDKNKAMEVGAVTALGKPPAVEALAAIMAKIENVSRSVGEPEEAVTTKPVIDEKAVIQNVLATIEQQLLPKLQQDTRHKAEEISRHVVAELTEKLVEAQIAKALVNVKQQLISETEDVADKTAQQVSTLIAQDVARDAASQAVQAVVHDANIPEQVTQFLSAKGEEWLGDQEEDLGAQLHQQLELLIPSIVTQYLDTHLESVIVPIVADKMPKKGDAPEPTVNTPSSEEIEKMIDASLNQYTNTVISPMVNNVVNKQSTAQELLEEDEEVIETIKGQLASLKTITIGLGLLVVGLVIAIIV